MQSEQFNQSIELSNSENSESLLYYEEDKMRKLLSLILVVTLLFSSTITVFADSNYDGVKVKKDNEKYRITEDVIDEVKTIATYDKINNTLSLEWFELKDKKIVKY